MAITRTKTVSMFLTLLNLAAKQFLWFCPDIPLPLPFGDLLEWGDPYALRCHKPVGHLLPIQFAYLCKWLSFYVARRFWFLALSLRLKQIICNTYTSRPENLLAFALIVVIASPNFDLYFSFSSFNFFNVVNAFSKTTKVPCNGIKGTCCMLLLVKRKRDYVLREMCESFLD